MYLWTPCIFVLMMDHLEFQHSNYGQKSKRTMFDKCLPKRRVICPIPEEDELDDGDEFSQTAAGMTLSRSSPPSMVSGQMWAIEMRASLEGALMAILPREERIKRAAATSQVEWSHVRESCAPPGSHSWDGGGTFLIHF